MDIIELGAIGELVGGVAVVASLIFVGIQIRSNTNTLRASSTYEAQHAWAVMNEQLALNPELCKAVDAWLRGSGDIDPNAKLVVTYWAHSGLQRLEAQYFLFKAGLMDRDLWENRRDMFRDFLATPRLREWWLSELPRSSYTREFGEQVNLEQGDT